MEQRQPSEDRTPSARALIAVLAHEMAGLLQGESIAALPQIMPARVQPLAVETLTTTSAVLSRVLQALAEAGQSKPLQDPQYAVSTGGILSAWTALRTKTSSETHYLDALQRLVRHTTSLCAGLGRDDIPVPSSTGVTPLHALEEKVSAQLALSARSSLENTQRAAEAAATAAVESAGLAAESALAHDFDSYSKQQSSLARSWTIGLFGLTAVVVLIDAYMVLRLPEGGRRMSVTTVNRLSVVVPLLLLAVYCGREASASRRTAREAEAIAVRLQALRAYTAALDPDQRQEISSSLGRDVFSLRTGERAGSTPAAEDVPDGGLVETLIALLQRLTRDKGA